MPTSIHWRDYLLPDQSVPYTDAPIEFRKVGQTELEMFAVEEDLANFFRDQCTPRFAEKEDRALPLLEPGEEHPRLRRFSGIVGAFERDQHVGRAVLMIVKVTKIRVLFNPLPLSRFFVMLNEA